MNVYVVVGSAGEYSDTNVWLVASFATYELAQEWADKATEYGKTAPDLRWSPQLGTSVFDAWVRENPYDRHWKAYEATYTVVGLPYGTTLAGVTLPSDPSCLT
jgi:hypothetical protein